MTFHPQLRKASADAVWSKQMVRGTKSRGPRDHCGVTSLSLRLFKLISSPMPAEAINPVILGELRRDFGGIRGIIKVFSELSYKAWLWGMRKAHYFRSFFMRTIIQHAREIYTRNIFICPEIFLSSLI